MIDVQLRHLHAAVDAERRARGLTWRAVADQTGVQAATLTRLGQGQGLDLRNFAALVDWLGVSADTFLRDGAPDPDSVEATLEVIRRALAQCRDIPDASREMTIQATELHVRAVARSA